MFALKEPFMSAGKKIPFTFHFQSEMAVRIMNYDFWKYSHEKLGLKQIL